MKNLIIILTLIITVFFVSCGEKETSVNTTAKAKTILLDTSSLPAATTTGTEEKTVYPAENSDNESSAEENIIDFYRDDFDSFDPDFWTVIEEKTGNLIPQQAKFQDGNLIIEAAETDRNPFFHSIPIEASSGDIIRIKRRAKIHAGNQYANISFSIYATEGTDLTVSKDIKKESIAGIQYLDFQYDKGRFPITTGVLLSVPGYKDSGEYKTLDPMFDTWVEEELEYHTDTGKVLFTINGQTEEIQGAPMTLPRFRVYMNAYGWHTGHRVTVDYLEISVESPGNIITAISSEKELIKESIPPSEERTVLETETGISVSLPGLVSESPQEISIKELELDDPEIISPVEVSLGNIHTFDSAVEITIPIPDGRVPEGKSAVNFIHPVSYNSATGLWVPEPALYDDSSVTILSSHLSTFALKPGPGIDLNYKGMVAESKKEAVESAWSSMTSNLDWVSQGQSFASMVSDNPFLGVLENPLGTVGTGFAIIDIAKNMAQGNDLNAGLGAIKVVSSWALGKFATMGTQIASIGTFFIDYSLNALATNTLDAQYSSFEKAYAAYYKSEGKSVYDWYNIIKGYLIESPDSETVSKELNKTIDEYVKSIWKDEAAFEGYLAEVKGHGWGGDAGLTPEIKQKLEANYKAELVQTLKPAISRAFEWVENQAYDAQFKAAYKANEILHQDIRYWVDVFGNRKNDKLEVVVFHNDTPMFTIKPSNSGAVDFLGFTTLSDFFKNPRPTHILLQGYLQIDENTTVPVSMKHELIWDSFSPTIEFDIDRSKYIDKEPEDTETEENESVETEEITTEEEYTVSFDDVKEWITPEEIGETNYSVFEIPVTSVSRIETYPSSIDVDFSSLSETEKAPKEPETGEYLTFITLENSNNDTIASASFNYNGYLENADYIPETGIGKSVIGDGSGNIYIEKYYMNGVQHGPDREYYDNGNIHLESFYKKGVMDGPSREYYENGQLMNESNYVNGEPNGLYQSFYENGQLESRSMSKGWANWGPYEVYYKNGQLSVKGQYLSYEETNGEKMGGIETGYWKRFYESGTLYAEEWYTKDGHFIEAKTYNEGGWLENHTFVKGDKTITESYDSKGNKTGETEY